MGFALFPSSPKNFRNKAPQRSFRQAAEWDLAVAFGTYTYGRAKAVLVTAGICGCGEDSLQRDLERKE